MTLPLQTLSSATAYATKPNIAYPGTSTQATAAETAATQRLADCASTAPNASAHGGLGVGGPPAVTESVGAGSIANKVAT